MLRGEKESGKCQRLLLIGTLHHFSKSRRWHGQRLFGNPAVVPVWGETRGFASFSFPKFAFVGDVPSPNCLLRLYHNFVMTILIPNGSGQPDIERLRRMLEE